MDRLDGHVLDKGKDMSKGILTGTVICLALVAWGCGDGDNPVNSRVAAQMDDSGVTPEGIAGVVSANNLFALEVYEKLRSDEGNLFLSPYSISTALTMVYEGARGETAEEIARVFHLPADSAERRAAFAAVHNRLNEPDNEYALSVANALWAQEDYGFLDPFLNALQNHYAAGASSLDFVGSTEEARQTINTWVEDRTNRKIRNLFPAGTLDANTRLVLTNAIYFKGEWATGFDPDQTRTEAFHVSPARTVNVPTMRLTGEDASFRYTEDRSVQVLELPYKGERLSMLILLPAADSLDAFENDLTPGKLNEWQDGLRKQRVDVFLPRFTYETKYFMNRLLQEMGMPAAFSQQADLSGMDGTRGLSIQHVIHQAFVEVNEEGTEAAAATGVAVGLTSVPQVTVFRADRPFLFAIQDTETGLLLFLGKIVDPTIGSATRN